MCDFILIGVSITTLDFLKATVPPGLHLWPCGSAALRQVVPATHAIYWVVAPHCSCGLWTEPEHQPASVPAYPSTWSAAKKARASRDSALAKANQPDPHAETSAFRAWLESLLMATGGPIYLHVAMYRGSQEGTAPPIAPEQRLKIATLLPPSLPRETLLRLTLTGAPAFRR
jgi:hypothetical protein